MSTQRQIPGGQFLNETTSDEHQIAGGVFVNQTVAATGGTPVLSAAFASTITTSSIVPNVTVTI